MVSTEELDDNTGVINYEKPWINALMQDVIKYLLVT